MTYSSGQAPQHLKNLPYAIPLKQDDHIITNDSFCLPRQLKLAGLVASAKSAEPICATPNVLRTRRCAHKPSFGHACFVRSTSGFAETTEPATSVDGQ